MTADRNAATQCAESGCPEPPWRTGFCPRHTGHRRYGTPMERFARKSRPEGHCLIWFTHLTADGYGLFSAEGKLQAAHRWIWEQVNGPIPAGVQLDHTCWRPACVAVDHLRLATPGQNSAHRKGASAANKSTGIRNVYPDGRKYKVRIRKNGVLFNFGTHERIEDAAKIATEERARLFGSYAGR